MTSRWDRIRGALVCPRCRESLVDSPDAVSCPECRSSYPVAAGCVSFRAEERPGEAEYLHGFRGRLRRSGLYPLVFRLLAPVLVTGPDPGRRYDELASRADAIVVDLGAGNDRRHPGFINCDILPYPEVDLVCEGDALPLASEAVDAFSCVVVLEHVPRVRELIAEARRCLKPGGRFFVVVPFLQPFHAAPHDYRRWTLRGLAEDLDGFDIVDQGVYGGPASSLAWLLGEFAALVCSLGSRRLRDRLALPMQALFSPIKWLDLVLAHHRDADRLASAIWVEAEKQ